MFCVALIRAHALGLCIIVVSGMHDMWKRTYARLLYTTRVLCGTIAEDVFFLMSVRLGVANVRTLTHLFARCKYAVCARDSLLHLC